jgi:hypothetical protein
MDTRHGMSLSTPSTPDVERMLTQGPVVALSSSRGPQGFDIEDFATGGSSRNSSLAREGDGSSESV